jgi:hypothetical protein
LISAIVTELGVVMHPVKQEGVGQLLKS